MQASLPADPAAPTGFWRTLARYRVGPLPLPLYVVIAAVTVLAAASKKLPNDMIGGFAVLMLLGFLLGEIGARLPVFRHVGGAAILCLFVPSALVDYKAIDPEMVQACLLYTSDAADDLYTV